VQVGNLCLLQVIAAAGVSTYNKAHAIILAGSVRVNGKIVKQPSYLVNPSADEIYIHGSLVRPRQKHKYVVVNKRAGIACSALLGIMNAWQGWDSNLLDKTRDTDKVSMLNHRLFLAGRLDSVSCGLQLISSDPDWAERVTRSAEGKHDASTSVCTNQNCHDLQHDHSQGSHSISPGVQYNRSLLPQSVAVLTVGR
jgi:16S rRNA U516 pseudouridylate synthase RsuA-like enzyme